MSVRSSLSQLLCVRKYNLDPYSDALPGHYCHLTTLQYLKHLTWCNSHFRWDSAALLLQ